MQLRGDLQPRKWQLAALEKWGNSFSGIAHVVTGGGKTIFSYLCIQRFFESYPEGRIIIVVPTLALMDQWAVDITDSMTITDEEIDCFSGSDKAKKPNTINIVVLNTARSISEWLAEGADTMLIVDECHRAATKENSRCLTIPSTAATLGLSATPYRDQDDGFEGYLEPFLGSIIYEYSYRNAHTDRVIVDFTLVNVEISLPESTALSLWNGKSTDSLKSEAPLTENEIRSSKRFTQAARAAWAVKLALKHRSERIVIFHERVDSIDSICRGLKAQGITSVAYHSRMSSAYRRDNLRLFRRGESNVLITCRALDEGTNVPESNVAIVAQSTSSTRQRIQRLGRVLRPATGKDRATVYTLFEAGEQEERLREEEISLEGVASIQWKRGSIK